MLVPVDGGKGFVSGVGTVKAIPPNANTESQFSVHQMEQERAPYKPKYLRCFIPSTRKNSTDYCDVIILHDFNLTAGGALKKCREYLQKHLS